MTGRYLTLLAFFALSILHVPAIYFGKESGTGGRDAIGLFDLVTVGLCIAHLRILMFVRILRVDQPALLFYLFLFLALLSFFVNFVYSGRFSTFGLLVILKNIQYVFVFYFFWSMIQRLTVHQVASIVAIGAVLFTVAGVIGLAAGFDYRLGFVWKEGETSPQPAGYFLALCLLFLFFYLKTYPTRHPLLYGGVVVFLWCGLFLTFSRTNNIAFLLCAAGVLFYRIPPLKIYLIALAGLALTAGLGVAFADINYREPILAYFLDPSLIFEDSSFGRRYRAGGIWFGGWGYISENPWNIWLGIGSGTVRIADGLLPQIFYSSGIIGITVYVSFFAYAVYRYRNFYFTLFVLLVFVNGIGSEGVLFAFRGVVPSLLMWAALIHFGCRGPVTRRRATADTPVSGPRLAAPTA